MTWRCQAKQNKIQCKLIPDHDGAHIGKRFWQKRHTFWYTLARVEYSALPYWGRISIRAYLDNGSILPEIIPANWAVITNEGLMLGCGTAASEWKIM